MAKSFDDGPDVLSQTCNDNVQNAQSYQPQIETENSEKSEPKVAAEIDEIEEELKEL